MSDANSPARVDQPVIGPIAFFAAVFAPIPVAFGFVYLGTSGFFAFGMGLGTALGITFSGMIRQQFKGGRTNA